MREKFEKFLGLEVRLKDGSIIYQEDKGRYRTSKFDASFINGAWYSFQEQQKIIDNLKSKLLEVVDSYVSGSDTDDMGEEIKGVLNEMSTL